MNRDHMLERVRETDLWDFIIIGGGATGLGVAIDAASRGYKTLLLEQHDFCKATSSRSTKLVHGGVRYLQQGNVSLVLEALKERGLLLKNAPHLVRNLPFVVPNYDWWEGPFYGIGMKVYDLLAGRSGFGRSKLLSKEKTLEHIPTIEPHGLKGGVIYYDGQFDDARLAVNMAQTAAEQEGVLVNYMKVLDLLKEGSEVKGVVAHDLEHDDEYQLRAKSVVNATGIFTDTIRKQDNPNAEPIMVPSQGVHIVLDRSFLPGDSAIMVPSTDDGRVLFAIPWYNRVVVGTTDTPIDGPSMEPEPMEHELEFLLEHAARYLIKDPGPDDVLSMFAGVRPLVAPGGAGDGSTSDISRDHYLHISPSGLVTIAGGKWTTYRKMAQDTIDQAATVAGLEDRPCKTQQLNIHGHTPHADDYGDLAPYGSDAPAIRDLMRQDASLEEKLHPDMAERAAQVVWAVRHEMARTVEDVLSRRTRMLLLHAAASIEAAPKVAALMAAELGRDEAWQEEEVRAYREVAEGYLMRRPVPSA